MFLREMNYAECRFRDPLLLQHGFYKNIPDENEQLKSDNECYVKRYSELFEDYIACKKENEQLKQELIEFKKWGEYVGDVRREDVDKVFKMSIYEIAEAFVYYEKRIKELEE